MVTEPAVPNRNGRSSLHMKKELPEMGLTINAFGDMPVEVVSLITSTLELLTTGLIPKRQGAMSDTKRESARAEVSSRAHAGGSGGKSGGSGGGVANKPFCCVCHQLKGYSGTISPCFYLFFYLSL